MEVSMAFEDKLITGVCLFVHPFMCLSVCLFQLMWLSVSTSMLLIWL